MWIAIDEDGRVNLFVNKPKLMGSFWMDCDSHAITSCLTLPKEAFPQLTWGHEPIEVILTTEDSQQHLYDMGFKDGKNSIK